MKNLSDILQIPDWEDIYNPRPINPGLSTIDYTTYYWIVIILGVVALILIVIYGLVGEEKEEILGYE